MTQHVLKLKKISGNGWANWVLRGQNMLCHFELLRFFDIPKEIKHIDVIISDEPMPSCYEFTFKVNEMSGGYSDLKVRLPDEGYVCRRWTREITYVELRDWARRKGLHTGYIQIQY